MVLRLEAIKFNHDSTSASVDALHIRKNEKEFVKVPEWRCVASVNPEDSPAAYALHETRGHTLTIQANFSCDDPSINHVNIRALDARINPPPASKSFFACLAVRFLLRTPLRNVLGEVKAKRVTLCEGESGFQTFKLDNVRIWGAGVGVQDIVWRWQYRLSRFGKWMDFALTTHRIYTVLRVPQLPWQQENHEPSNTQLPWVDVLDHACCWAAQTHNADDAAALVTRSLNDLGLSGVVTYDSSAHYTDPQNFDCQAFLDDLRGKCGGYVCVNCDDCAAIVSTFANIVGCALSQMYIEPVNTSLIGLKPIIRIGTRGWLEEDDFDYHEVASEGCCSEKDEVFDACVQVAAVDEPDPTKRMPLLPTNLRFGRVRERGYRSRLVRPECEAKCRPRPQSCRRRRLGAANRLAAHNKDQLRILKERHSFDDWALKDAAGLRRFVLNFFLDPHILPDWQPVRLLTFDKGEEKEEPPGLQSFLKLTSYADTALRLDVFECASWRDAREGVVKLLARFQQRGMIRRETPELGDVVFAEDTFGTILFATGNLIFFVRKRCKNRVCLVDVAKALNKTVLNPPENIVSPDYWLTHTGGFRFESEYALIGDSVTIEREYVDLLARKRFYHFFTPNGEVSRCDGRLIYQPKTLGLNLLEIYAVDALGNAFRQVLRLNVRQE